MSANAAGIATPAGGEPVEGGVAVPAATADPAACPESLEAGDCADDAAIDSAVPSAPVNAEHSAAIATTSATSATALVLTARASTALYPFASWSTSRSTPWMAPL
jgi:hypothetical protein